MTQLNEHRRTAAEILVSTTHDMAAAAGLYLNAVILDSFHEVEERERHTLTLATMEKTARIELGDEELMGYPLLTGEAVAVKIRMGINELL